jgi:hypothetical protein
MKCPFFLEHTRFRTRAPRPPHTHTHTHTHKQTHTHTQSVCSCLAKHWNLCTYRLGGGGVRGRISGGLVSGRVSSTQRQLTMAVFVPPPRRYTCENVKQYTQATCIYLSFVNMSVRAVCYMIPWTCTYMVARANMCEKRISWHLIFYSINMVNPRYHMNIMC